MFVGANAIADTAISLAVSPQSVVGSQPVQLAISGEQQGTTSWALIGEESCPENYGDLYYGNLKDFFHVYQTGETPSLPFTTSVRVPEEKGAYRFCGWVGYALSEATLTVTESQEEAEIAATATEEAAKQAAEVAAAKARAHKTRVKHLSVKAVSHSRHFSADPGYTNLDVTTSPYVHVVVKLTRYGHSTESFEWGSRSTAVAEVIHWSCKSPGGTYHYIVTARSDVGQTLERRGTFAPVSVGRCHALKQQEAEARERRERENREARERSEREYAEEQMRAERTEREELEKKEADCRAEGGTPITLYVGEEYGRYCRAPYGGLLPVP